MRRPAMRITEEAHLRAMRDDQAGDARVPARSRRCSSRPFRSHGFERAAYGSIVGSGANATVLHYRANNRKMEAGDLLLIDAGCEYEYYASDVTRTFPVERHVHAASSRRPSSSCSTPRRPASRRRSPAPRSRRSTPRASAR